VQIWHCNVASRVTKSLEAPEKGIDLIRKLDRHMDGGKRHAVAHGRRKKPLDFGGDPKDWG